MQMQVIVSACFSLYTYERYSGAPQPAISLTQQTASSTAIRTLFNHNKQLLQSQPEALFIIRAMIFRSINVLTALKLSLASKYSQRYLFAHRHKIKGQNKTLRLILALHTLLSHPNECFFDMLSYYLTMQTHP